MSIVNIKVTSIPIFIKEYIRNNKWADLKLFADKAVDILNKSVFEYIINGKGNRDLIKVIIKDCDNDTFTIDVFFSFFKEKLERVEKGYIKYEKELGLMDLLKNEVFGFELTDEFGDTEKFNVSMEDYDNSTYTISFMKI